jgi:hypothetical protein
MALPPSRPNAPILELPADIRPVYANLARIAHHPADILIDFAHLVPGENRARITARVAMTPISAKLLLRALNDNLARYESAYGEIVIPASSLADHLFKPFQAPPENDPEKEKG